LDRRHTVDPEEEVIAEKLEAEAGSEPAFAADLQLVTGIGIVLAVARVEWGLVEEKPAAAVALVGIEAGLVHRE